MKEIKTGNKVAATYFKMGKILEALDNAMPALKEIESQTKDPDAIFHSLKLHDADVCLLKDLMHFRAAEYEEYVTENEVYYKEKNHA